MKTSYPQDIPENGADVSHLYYLHTAGVSSGSDVKYKELLAGILHTHEWLAKWEALPEPTSYISRLNLRMTNIIFGFKIKSLDLNVTADQVGCLQRVWGGGGGGGRWEGEHAYFYGHSLDQVRGYFGQREINSLHQNLKSHSSKLTVLKSRLLHMQGMVAISCAAGL